MLEAHKGRDILTWQAAYFTDLRHSLQGLSGLLLFLLLSVLGLLVLVISSCYSAKLLLWTGCTANHIR